MHRQPTDLSTMTFDWGAIKWLVTPDDIPGAGSTFGQVVINPGKGHARHSHPDAEEVLYVVAGEGLQTVDDCEPFPIRAGDAVYVPQGAVHSTVNSSWLPLQLIATYTPGGAEKPLRGAPDFREIAPGAVPVWAQAEGDAPA